VERERTQMTRRVLGQTCCTTTPSAMCYWIVMFGLFYGAALLAGAVWPAVRPYGDALILTALASACFLNFSRNRTLHCGLTGPFFLLAAIVAVLIERGMWNIDSSVLWGMVLVGVGVAFVLEWWFAADPARGDRALP
jgi:hypothetical protein